MNKKTQAIIGVVAVGAVAYYLWNKNKFYHWRNPPLTAAGGKTFANLTSKRIPPRPMCGKDCVDNYCYTSDKTLHVCSGTKWIQSIPSF